MHKIIGLVAFVVLAGCNSAGLQGNIEENPDMLEESKPDMSGGQYCHRDSDCPNGQWCGGYAGHQDFCVPIPPKMDMGEKPDLTSSPDLLDLQDMTLTNDMSKTVYLKVQIDPDTPNMLNGLMGERDQVIAKFKFTTTGPDVQMDQLIVSMMTKDSFMFAINARLID
mgnify:FL=1